MIRAALAALALLLAVPQAASAAPPEASCTSAYGKTACGYDCVAAYGEVRCADVPWGACLAAYGVVVCGPSGPAPRRRAMPKATCQAAFGKIACGYGCVAAYGELACSPDPDGTCVAAYGRVTCSAPAVPHRHHHHREGAKQECRSAYGQTACGYGCVAAYGAVRCAPTPDGACTAAYGKITCSGD